MRINFPRLFTLAFSIFCVFMLTFAPAAFAIKMYRCDGKIQGTHLPALDESTEGGQWHPEAAVGVRDWVIAGLGWTEHPLHRGIVVEEREEHGDAFDNGRPKTRLDPPPVIVEPALHRLELSQPRGIAIEIGISGLLAFFGPKRNLRGPQVVAQRR